MSLAQKIDMNISEQEYLDGEQISEIKHEYIDGSVYAMAGASKNHNRISQNISRNLGNNLIKNNSPCEIFSSDMKVKLRKNSLKFFYPDVMVVCDSNNDDYYQNSPIIIIEILSKSTRKNDLSTKKLSYFNIPSLQEYVVIEQDFCEINVFRKSNHWNTSIYFLGDDIHFESIDTTLSVEDIYYQVDNEDMTQFLADDV